MFCLNILLHEEDDLWLTICACYSSEIALNTSLCVSIDNMQDWRGIQKEAEVNSIQILCGKV